MNTNAKVIATPSRVPVLSVDDAAGDEGTQIKLTFSNGKVLTVDLEALSPEIKDAALRHGIKQKLVDASAIARDLDTGRSASVDDKYNAVKEVFDRITSEDGTWNKAREAGGTSGAGLLCQALMQLSGKTRDEINSFLTSRTKQEQAALRDSPQVSQIIAEIKAKSAKGNAVDTQSLLGELLGTATETETEETE